VFTLLQSVFLEFDTKQMQSIRLNEKKRISARHERIYKNDHGECKVYQRLTEHPLGQKELSKNSGRY